MIIFNMYYDSLEAVNTSTLHRLFILYYELEMFKMRKELAKSYSPKDFEDRIYKYWNENNCFKAEIDKNKEPYTIVIPPPNITGQLHMGHALDETLQDILIRWKRMSGYAALWRGPVC